MSYPTAIAMVMALPCLYTLTNVRREERATPRELAGIVVHAIGALLSTAHSVHKEDGMDAVHEQLIREVRVAAYYDRCSPFTMTAADIDYCLQIVHAWVDTAQIMNAARPAEVHERPGGEIPSAASSANSAARHQPAPAVAGGGGFGLLDGVERVTWVTDTFGMKHVSNSLVQGCPQDLSPFGSAPVGVVGDLTPSDLMVNPGHRAAVKDDLITLVVLCVAGGTLDLLRGL
jgi:hypothetical protein